MVAYLHHRLAILPSHTRVVQWLPGEAGSNSEDTEDTEDAEHTEDTEDNVYSETRQLDLIQLAADVCQVCVQGTEEETSR